MDEQPSNNGSPAIDLESLKQLNFGPGWTREPPKTSFDARSDRPHRADRGNDRRSSRGPGPPRSALVDAKPPPREDRRPRPASRGDAMPGGRQAVDRSSAGFRGDERRPRRPRERPLRENRPPEDAGEPLPLRVSFLPRQKVLSAIIRQIAVSRKAYQLMEVAALFFANEDACDIRVEFQQAPPELRLYQCNICGAVSMEQDLLVRHILASHLEDYFERQEIVGDLPAGSFACVARCRLSGALIGPPNHHSYSEALREIHASRFPDMSFEEYSRRVEIVRDPALIEQWKEQVRRQILFKRKGAEGDDANPVKRAAAETWLIRNKVRSLISNGRRAVLPRKVAAAIKERSLLRAFVDAWRREKQFPASLMFALHGAFRSRHLFTFKTGQGVTFVTAIEPAPLNAACVVEDIREILAYLRDHPGARRPDLVRGLRPELAPDSLDAAKLLSPLGWLIEKGHIVEFSDGALAAPGATHQRQACFSTANATAP
ncbi:MAG: hypothetical protein QME60_06825 [Verrucomicrobiota bacterium]|nr:hypothetical protein [Verrucomicrobiota bacterium]